MKNKRINVGIAGLGLIGSSILKGLSFKKDYELFVCSKSSYRKALEYTKNSSDDIKILKNSDIVFVCADISKTPEILNELNLFLDKKTIVCDAASIKKDLLKQRRNFNFNFILSHPMAGSEKSGFDFGTKELFIGAKWLIEKENIILNKIISELGARAVVVDMEKHDKLCAEISHFPLVLSCLLFDGASDEAKNIASSGFRDMTRLALTKTDLSLNMFKNEENISACFDMMTEKLKKLKNMSEIEKAEYFSEISKKRKQMYDKDGKNIFSI